MATFTTFTQFDKKFDNIKKYNKDRSACPLFGLLSCYKFMKDGEISQSVHENNICVAVDTYVSNEIPKYMMFDELLELSTLNANFIGATTPELITTGIMGYENIFKFGYTQNYCVLILKNSNYIAVLCKVDQNSLETFAVRDCHEKEQYNFKSFEELRKHLDKTYQFEQMTMAGGVMIPEFSNIEYMVIDEPFQLTNIETDSGNINETHQHSFEDDYAYALALQMEEDQENNYDEYV